MVNEQHFRRGDITNQVARSTEVRKKYAKENFLNMIIRTSLKEEM